MISLVEGQPGFRVREGKVGDEIFDTFRRKWVALTPEEFVRQSILRYMVLEKQYPSSLVAVERGIKVGELKRRFDAVIFDRSGKPWMVIECKAPGVSIHAHAVDQMLAYQSILGANFLLLTNGNLTRCWQVKERQVIELNEIPGFP